MIMIITIIIIIIAMMMIINNDDDNNDDATTRPTSQNSGIPGLRCSLEKSIRWALASQLVKSLIRKHGNVANQWGYYRNKKVNGFHTRWITMYTIQYTIEWYITGISWWTYPKTGEY